MFNTFSRSLIIWETAIERWAQDMNGGPEQPSGGRCEQFPHLGSYTLTPDADHVTITDIMAHAVRTKAVFCSIRLIPAGTRLSCMRDGNQRAIAVDVCWSAAASSRVRQVSLEKMNVQLRHSVTFPCHILEWGYRTTPFATAYHIAPYLVDRSSQNRLQDAEK